MLFELVPFSSDVAGGGAARWALGDTKLDVLLRDLNGAIAE
jgi:hypothetical protein